MHYEKYPVKTSRSTRKFEFYSTGPKGPVRKQVHFIRRKDMAAVYDLFLGDFKESGYLDVDVVTDNHDSKKVLATVAYIIIQFLEMYTNASVVFTGSSLSRIRLYRMAISNNIAHLSSKYEVFGLVNGIWKYFEGGDECKAFMIQKTKFE